MATITPAPFCQYYKNWQPFDMNEIVIDLSVSAQIRSCTTLTLTLTCIPMWHGRRPMSCCQYEYEFDLFIFRCRSFTLWLCRSFNSSSRAQSKFNLSTESWKQEKKEEEEQQQQQEQQKQGKKEEEGKQQQKHHQQQQQKQQQQQHRNHCSPNQIIYCSGYCHA